MSAPSGREKKAGALGIVLGAALTLGAGMVTSYVQHARDVRDRREDSRQRAYYRLVGLRHAYCTTKILELRAEADVDLAGAWQSYFDTETRQVRAAEAQRPLKEHQDALTGEYYRLQRELIETLGEVRVAFKDDPKVAPLILKIATANLDDLTFNVPALNPADSPSAANLLAARFTVDARAAIQNAVNKTLGHPIYLLIYELEERLGIQHEWSEQMAVQAAAQ